jgi:hypothetical protein
VTLLLLNASVALVAPGAASAQSGPIKLAILPVGQPGSFFDLTMAPGETRTFAIDIANDGVAALAARTYAADVYTIINGGFGARLRGEPQSGMTSWLDYRTAVWDLQAGQVIRRPFAIRVPADAGPGEYIASLVLENDRPIRGNGNIGVNQIIRQAVAVVVTVPGQRNPVLAIGEARHKVVAGNSVVSVAVANTGNVRLKPVVTFTLLDAAGTQITQASIQMDTFYAHTETFVEVPLAVALLPGVYTVHLTLDDAGQDVRADSAAIALVVEAPASTAPGPGGPAGLTAVNQAVGEDQNPPNWGVVIIAGLLLCGVVAGLLSFALLRRRRIVVFEL